MGKTDKINNKSNTQNIPNNYPKTIEEKNINHYELKDEKLNVVIKKRYKLKKNVYALIIGITLFILIFSTYKIYDYLIESQKSKTLIKNISESTEVVEHESNNAEIIESEEHPDSPYWNFIKMNLIDVDFSKLIKINSDTVAWITVGGTNVNYPVVQTIDNDFYLNHSFNKSKNSGGWLFMDYRNNKIEYEKNTIIYAHNMKDQTMFGTLKKLLTNDWYNVEDNRVIKLSSPSYNTLWQIYSVYTIDTTNDYIKTDFINDEEYQQFLNLVKGRSYRNFNTNVTTTDKTLTLSTCHGNTKKLVVHAKLIKIEAK